MVHIDVVGKVLRSYISIALLSHRIRISPIMIELFSKAPGHQLHESDMVIIPLHIPDEASSLSAIMLNDDYYEFMMSGRKVVNCVGVLGAEHQIPFEIRAWLDLCRRKSEGGHVN